MRLCDDDDHLNDEARISKQLWDDSYYDVVEHTLRYLVGRSKEQGEIEDIRDAEFKRRSWEADGLRRRSGGHEGHN